MILKLERRVSALEDFERIVKFGGYFRPSSDKGNRQGSVQEEVK